MKILLTDDSKIMRKILRHTLSKIDYQDVELFEAGDGVEALRALEQNNYKFDLIILDLYMDGMNGIDTLKKIRSNLKSAKLPVLVCSSANDRIQVVEAINSGASGYIVKPFHRDELKDKIDAIVNSSD